MLLISLECEPVYTLMYANTYSLLQSQGGAPAYDPGPQLARPSIATLATADSATADIAASMEVEGGFLFKTPMDNLVIKTFQFPVR